MLEKLCNKTVDVINETLTKKYHFVKISQSKKGHIYLIVKKKRGRLIGEEQRVLHRKTFNVFSSVFNWFSEKNKFINENYYLNFKVLKECSNYHFHYFLISSDKYVNKYF